MSFTKRQSVYFDDIITHLYEDLKYAKSRHYSEEIIIDIKYHIHEIMFLRAEMGSLNEKYDKLYDLIVDDKPNKNIKSPEYDIVTDFI